MYFSASLVLSLWQYHWYISIKIMKAIGLYDPYLHSYKCLMVAHDHWQMQYSDSIMILEVVEQRHILPECGNILFLVIRKICQNLIAPHKIIQKINYSVPLSK